ncbi:transporter [Mycolicibacterium aichiense]|uniref:PH-like domain-containing protein n=1 Tax=Mycolicibacterium aichiense TaxID=1799 RepID=UPI000E029F04|nr:transporter [Mycolicibacterium aichiense]MCV7019947.1 transporter [Mycolicibacterium aichiense]STZ81353.1 putative export or membrane protein [Mycolicibacterium aichiense]
MNTGTAIGSFVFAFVIVVIIGVLIGRMLRGWKRRARRQMDLLGELPPLPDLLGSATIAPTRGLYIGSTLAPNWLERIAAGDLGYRSKAVLTGYPEGILLERSGATPIWIPHDAITAIRTERGLAGKVIPGGRNKSESPAGILAIRWRLPSGTEIDTGFRGDDRRDYARWTTTGEAA